MFKAQFGKAEYSKDIAFAISTRIDAAGCFGFIEYDREPCDTSFTNTQEE